MNIDKFWQKARDLYTIYHTKYKHALLTEEEKRQTATDFLADIWALSGEWYSLEDETKK